VNLTDVWGITRNVRLDSTSQTTYDPSNDEITIGEKRIQRASVHSLRHILGAREVKRGINVRGVQEAMGYKDENHIPVCWPGTGIDE